MSEELGSVMSYQLSKLPAVGASGAIFGLVCMIDNLFPSFTID